MSGLDFVVDTFVGSDGSKYYGTLRNGVPSGLGTCIWPNQCHYDGEWRNGVMHGFGTYVWRNGQRYDGEWKDGRRDGIGIKTYVDGSMYDGFWRAGKKHGLGVFRPAPEEPNSRRHSNQHGWQPGQQQSVAGADGAVPGMHPVESSNVLAETEGVDLAPLPAAVAPFQPDAAELLWRQQQKQQLKQQRPEAAVSPFVAAAAALNSEASVILPPTDHSKVHESWKPGLSTICNGTSAEIEAQQQQQSAAVNGAITAAGEMQDSRAQLAAAAAAADAPSTSPMVRASRGSADGSSAATAAVAAASAAAAAAAAAPRKLFVREYDMGQLLREYPLTSEEIKMIFGFLWPKNKVKRRVQRVLRRGPRMQKKLGEVVYKGHYSYSLMLELQLGIRYSAGRVLRPRGLSSGHSASSLLTTSLGLGVLRPWWLGSATLAGSSCISAGSGGKQQQQQLEGVLAGETGGGELLELDFKEKLTVYFPSSGSSTTPAHPSTDFKWKDYCPRVFRRLRASSSIDEADYMLSLAGSQALRQLNSPGKSGSMFLLSEDERFLVKTMRKSEMAVLLRMLPAYAAHMEACPNSLITRFFGLHKVTPLHGRSVRFVVMANIFVTDLQIHRRYDIKGSTDGRTVGPAGRAKAADGDPNVIFKDLDVDMRIVLEQSAHDTLMKQLAADCELLRTVGVMDYSLLLGVHYPGRNFTRMSLDPVPSASLDGLPLHASPLPGAPSTLPGSGVTSTQGSFLDPNYLGSVGGAAGGAAGAGTTGGAAYAGGLSNGCVCNGAAAAAAAAAASVVGPAGAGGAVTNAQSTISDDEVQQPPQQLQRLVLQQQQLTAQLQEAAAASAVARNLNLRPSLEQVPMMQQQQQQYVQFYGRRSTSEEVQLPPAVPSGVQGYSGPLSPISSGAAAAAGNGGNLSGAGAFPSTAFAAGVSAGGGSTAGSHQGGHAGGIAAGVSASSAGARNWELYSAAAEQEERLNKVVERMQNMGFSEQRMKDVAELARLKILGGKLKKSAARKEPPSAVLQAMQQQRQEAEGGLLASEGPLGHGAAAAGQPPSSPSATGLGSAAGNVVRHTAPMLSHLTSLRGAFTGLGVPFEEDEEIVDTPMALGIPDPKAPSAGAAAVGLYGGQLGINIPAVAVPTAPLEQQLGAAGGTTGSGAAGGAGKSSAGGAGDQQRGPEEVVLCFGIIDILQDYSTRKVLERTLKGITHEKAAISVAPPKLYAKRFLDFATNHVFMSETAFRQQQQQQQGQGSSNASITAASNQGGCLTGVLQLQGAAVGGGIAGMNGVGNGVLQQPPWTLTPIVTSSATGEAEGSTPGAAGVEANPIPKCNACLAGVSLETEDSYPMPPGQLAGEASSAGLDDEAAAAAAATAGQQGRQLAVQQQGPPAAVAMMPDVGSQLLDLLAAPTGMIELTSPVAAAGADGQLGGSLSPLVSAEEVSVSFVEGSGPSTGARLGSGPEGEDVVANGDSATAIVVPAVVVELQGLVNRPPAGKQGSIEQHDAAAAAAVAANGLRQ